VCGGRICQTLEFLRTAITASFRDQAQLLAHPWLHGPSRGGGAERGGGAPALILMGGAGVVPVPAPAAVEAALMQVLQAAVHGWDHVLPSVITVGVALLDACPARLLDRGAAPPVATHHIHRHSP
jgi:hypothetical protein